MHLRMSDQELVGFRETVLKIAVPSQWEEQSPRSPLETFEQAAIEARRREDLTYWIKDYGGQREEPMT